MARAKSRTSEHHPELMRLCGVSRNIGEKEVLKAIDMQVKPGKVQALCGPNGAGKTTLIRIMLGLLAPDEGEVWTKLDAREISFQLHATGLFPDLSLRQNCRFFMASRGKPWSESDFRHHLALLRLDKEGDARIGTLSRGMQQRADLVRALMEKPRLLILDEPTSHLDPVGKVEVRSLLQWLVREKGLSLLLTSHLLDEVEKLADHVWILHKGEILWQGEVGNNPQTEHIHLESKFMEIVGHTREGEYANC